MMTGRPYKYMDFGQIEEWCGARVIAAPSRNRLPRYGWIVEGVAVGFLYQMECHIGILDCYISNPRSDAPSRSQALHEISIELIKIAKNIGIQQIQCDTEHKSIMNLAESFGFRETGRFTGFVKEI